jgi:hypothetical protein
MKLLNKLRNLKIIVKLESGLVWLLSKTDEMNYTQKWFSLPLVIVAIALIWAISLSIYVLPIMIVGLVFEITISYSDLSYRTQDIIDFIVDAYLIPGWAVTAVGFTLSLFLISIRIFRTKNQKYVSK